MTRLPASGWAPAEFEVVRGPIREGLVTYRCEAVTDPAKSFVFTDTPLFAGTLAVAVGTLALVVLAWWAALTAGCARRSRGPGVLTA